MPNLILDLEVNRVDLVDEGANSAAFIKLYKRKENHQTMGLEEILAKMKPEHAEAVKQEIAKAKAEVPAEVATELEKTKEELQTAKEAAEEVQKSKGQNTGSDNMEEVLKGLDPSVQEVFKSLKAQKEAAEEVVKQQNAQRVQEEAIAKAKDLKALPVEEAKLVDLMKGITPEVYEVLKAANALIENSAALEEVGKSKGNDTGTDAWTKIEKKAEEIATRDSVTKQKAIAKAIKENPELYREYLAGGAN